MTVRTLLSTALFLLSFTPTAMAVETNNCPPENASGFFCDSMNDEALYDQNSFDSYKMLVEGKNGWIFRSQSDFKKDFSLPKDSLDDLEELNHAYKQHGVKLVVLLTPTRGLMHHGCMQEQDRKKYGMEDVDAAWRSYKSLVESIRKRDIHVVSLDRIPGDQSFFYKRDHHWNPDGAKMAAQAVANYIKKMPEYESIEKIEYASQTIGSHDFYGVSKKVFKKICNSEQPPETIARTLTEKKSNTSTVSDLFGETKIPDIVLMGTSNSTMEPSFANFEGYLKEALSADLVNMSVSGGGLDTAMISYLSSDYYRDNPAKIAVWEIPSYYNLQENKNFFRESIPGAYGQCRENALAKVEGKKIDDNNFIVLDKLSDKKISSSDYYAEINFSQPFAKSFSIDFRYKKGKDRYKFQRTGRAARDHRYFLSLPEMKGDTLEKVILTVPQEAIGTSVDVALCKKGKSLQIVRKGGEPKTRSSVRDVLQKMKINFNPSIKE